MNRPTCRECGELLDGDGDCEWCANYERVMDSAPGASNVVEFVAEYRREP